MKFFNLQEGEKVVQEIKPQPNLKWYFFFTGAGLVPIFPFFVFLFLISNVIGLVEALSSAALIIAGAVAIGVAIGYVFSALRYGKQYYWITNKRIVYKRGLIGYKITSIPFERVSDAIISRTFIEKIFGIASLHIQSLAGQMSGPHQMGSEGVLLAISNPEETQELIFKLIKQKRKDERLSF